MLLKIDISNHQGNLDNGFWIRLQLANFRHDPPRQLVGFKGLFGTASAARAMPGVFREDANRLRGEPWLFQKVKRLLLQRNVLA